MKNINKTNSKSLINFAEKFLESFHDIVQASSEKAIQQMPPLIKKPGMALAISDARDRHMLELSSKRPKQLTIDGELADIEYVDPNKYGLIAYQDNKSLERVLFPYISSQKLEPFLKITADTQVRNFAFSTPEYKDKHWKDIQLVNFCSKNLNIPFLVENGTFVGMNLLHGMEIGGKRYDKYIEFVIIFGQRNLIPSHANSIRDLVFDLFFNSLFQKPNYTTCKFTNYLKELNTQIQDNVLLLGPYGDETESDFVNLKNILSTYGYNGMKLEDFPDIPIMSNSEKLLFFTICSGFVVLLDTSPSGHLAELADLMKFRYRPVIIIRKNGKASTTFLDDKLLTDKDYFQVANISEITSSTLLSYIKWAQEKIKTQIDKYNKINSWR